MPDEFWKIFHLRPHPVKYWPESIRAWMTIAAMVGCCSLIVYVLMTSVLLVRLGWDALFSPAPIYQEATRNFLLAFASAFGAPFLVWRTWVAHQQAKAAGEQARVALENHITGIFSKSVELLGYIRETKAPGQDGTPVIRSAPNIESRLGTIYSLERLLHESEKDQRAILETLCAYVRENSPLEIPNDQAEASIFHRGDAPPAPTRRGDVQAALTTIGRRSENIRARAQNEGWRLDLRNANLIAYDFSTLNFDRANFANSFLNAANMTGASFENCVFTHTFLRAAKMKRACFRASLFDDCDLTKAEIEATDFSSAKFIRTDLRKANVVSLDIRGADLEEAFGYYLQYAIESVKKEGVNYFNSKELLDTYELFKKTTYDENTNVSQPFRDAVELMIQSSAASGA